MSIATGQSWDKDQEDIEPACIQARGLNREMFAEPAREASDRTVL